MKPIYTLQVLSVGGLTGHVESSDGALILPFPRPMANRPSSRTTNNSSPRRDAACFASVMDHVARQQKLEIGQITILNKVALGPNDAGGFEIAVGMDITVPNLARRQRRLSPRGRAICPNSNAT